MIEKRFKINNEDIIMDNGRILDIYQIVDMLNIFDKELKSNKNIMSMQEMRLCELSNNLSAIRKWGVKAPCFNEKGEYVELEIPDLTENGNKIKNYYEEGLSGSCVNYGFKCSKRSKYNTYTHCCDRFKITSKCD